MILYRMAGGKNYSERNLRAKNAGSFSRIASKDLPGNGICSPTDPALRGSSEPAFWFIEVILPACITRNRTRAVTDSGRCYTPSQTGRLFDPVRRIWRLLATSDRKNWLYAFCRPIGTRPIRSGPIRSGPTGTGPTSAGPTSAGPTAGSTGGRGRRFKTRSVGPCFG